jgi:uncharacterized protein YndB with AHSA1/START domain
MLGPDGWTMPVCEIDLRPGGKWHFVWRKANGTEMGMHGEYREVTPPERLVSTEKWGDEWPETLNTLFLSEANGKTTMTNTILYRSKEARDAALKTGMKEGAAQSFDRLDTYVEKLGAPGAGQGTRPTRTIQAEPRRIVRIANGAPTRKCSQNPIRTLWRDC